MYLFNRLKVASSSSGLTQLWLWSTSFSNFTVLLIWYRTNCYCRCHNRNNAAVKPNCYLVLGLTCGSTSLLSSIGVTVSLIRSILPVRLCKSTLSRLLPPPPPHSKNRYFLNVIFCPARSISAATLADCSNIPVRKITGPILILGDLTWLFETVLNFPPLIGQRHTASVTGQTKPTAVPRCNGRISKVIGEMSRRR